MTEIGAETIMGAMKAVMERDYAKAERIFTQLIASGTNVSDSLYGLGLVRMHFEQDGAAKGHFEECLKLNPKNADAAYNLGLLAEKAGQEKVAQSFYRKSFEINPAHAAARRKVQATPGN